MKEWESATDYKNLPETATDKPKKNTMGITKSRMGSSRVKGGE